MATFSRRNGMSIKSDVYCDGTVLEQIEALSFGHCTMKCLNEPKCVSYSYHVGFQCALHGSFCSLSLEAETGSLFAGEYVSVDNFIKQYWIY